MARGHLNIKVYRELLRMPVGDSDSSWSGIREGSCSPSDSSEKVSSPQAAGEKSIKPAVFAEVSEAMGISSGSPSAFAPGSIAQTPMPRGPTPPPGSFPTFKAFA